MATKVFMEALSPTMEEGRLVKWHKREGDAVKTGETLAEVETDKAVMDLVARADGVLRQVAVTEGQTVPVGNVVAVIAAPGETVDASVATPAAVTSGNVKREMGNVGVATATAPVAVAPAQPVSGADATRVKASPLAKRMAKEAGVDLKLVTGSGPGGRVVRRDLETAGRVEKGEVRSVAASAAVQRSEPLPSPVSPVAARSGGAYEDVPLTQIRKTIAKRLAAPDGPRPHLVLPTEVDLERPAEARDALNRHPGPRAHVCFNA